MCLMWNLKAECHGGLYLCPLTVHSENSHTVAAGLRRNILLTVGVCLGQDDIMKQKIFSALLI